MAVPNVVQADTGLGTTYERWALNRLLRQLHSRLGFQSVLEAPDDGMTGISGLNSLVLGLLGVKVSLLLPDPERAGFARKVWQTHAPDAVCNFRDHWDGRKLPYDDGQFDFVWNFNIMTRQENPLDLLEEMCRVSNRYLFICVPNKSNYSFWLHRLHHSVARDPWDHGRVEWMRPQPWQDMLSKLGLRVLETHWLDCPWWPDIVDPGQMIKDFFPFMKRWAARARPENRYRWNYAELPYYRPTAFPDIHQRMARIAFFESSPKIWIKRLFAHHVGILASKG